MNKGGFFLLIASFLLAGSLFLTPTTMAFADSHSTSSQQNPSFFNQFKNWETNFFNHYNNGHHDGNDNDKNKDCSKHPENPNCSVSVPEFSVIPGLVAAGASAGSFYLLKRKKK